MRHVGGLSVPLLTIDNDDDSLTLTSVTIGASGWRQLIRGVAVLHNSQIRTDSIAWILQNDLDYLALLSHSRSPKPWQIWHP